MDPSVDELRGGGRCAPVCVVGRCNSGRCAGGRCVAMADVWRLPMYDHYYICIIMRMYTMLGLVVSDLASLKLPRAASPGNRGLGWTGSRETSRAHTGPKRTGLW